jgi:[acyl-carrier-protein] S-malonyltransferase
MVRWTESVRWLTTDGGVTHLAELGAGKVLSGLAKRIAPDVPAVSVGTPADVDAFVAELSQ